MFAFIDWNNLQSFHYIALGGGGVLVLALLMYLLPARVRDGMKIPGIIVAAVGGVALGTAAGALGMAYYGDAQARRAAETTGDPQPNAPPMVAPGQGGPGPGRVPMGMPAPGGGGGGGRNAPSAKRQLAVLVAKLDALTGKPLTLDLPADRRAKVLEQLQGLDKDAELKEDEAKKRLDALHSLLEKDEKTLEAVGYRMEGGGGGGGRQPPANPFKEGDAVGPYRALQKRLDTAPQQ